MPKLENIFASRFLKARKSNKLLSFLSITSVVGIMLGVATLIIVVSVMDGFTENLKQKFLGANPHIMVTKMDASPIYPWEDVVDEVKGVPHVTGGSPFVLGNAMISNGRTVNGVIVRGLDIEREKLMSGIAASVTSGSFNDLAGTADLPGILLGREMIFSLGASVGSEVTLISPMGTRGAFGIIPKMTKFRVVGLFDTGMYEYNRTMVYLSLEEAQKFFLMDQGISGIGVMVDNADRAEAVGRNIQTMLNGDGTRLYWVRDWLSMNQSLFAALKLEQYAMFVILTLITIVASFNIVSMITVTVKDKRKDVAILRAMGAEEKFIEKIFVRQGLIIGALGTFLGNALALVIIFVLKNFKIVTIPKEIYFSDTIPVKLTIGVFVVVTVCALIITYIAAKIPSRISAKIDPIEAIRND